MKEQKGLEKTKSGIAVMNSKIPEAMTGGYALTIEELSSAIKEFKKQEQKQQDKINQIKAEIKRFSVSAKEWETIRQKLPTWREIFLNTDVSRKRVLANKLIERIDIRKDNINIRFRIDLNEFLRSRMSMGHGVSEPRI